ncbi:MAG: hypothetical protein CMM58_09705 [Rhodospirillaceae bacterium]|nr:hypothetical protein [Rhodospirillaceae bacterium]|tara:strand:+ start:59 stop:511 length:453 start_codon:yes stop_codon:yes gene_type:complete
MVDHRAVVERFVGSMTSLMELLVQETAILTANKYKELEPLQTRKVQLAKAYEDAQNSLQENANTLDHLTSEERDDLKLLYKKFRGVLSENMIVLRGSHDATDRVIKLVIDAVKKERGMSPESSTAFKSRPQGYQAYTRAENTNATIRGYL